MEEIRQIYEPGLQDFQPNAAAAAALRETLKECSRQGVHVILVIAPEGPRFRSFYGPTTWTKLEAFLTSLAQEYGTTLINGRTWINDESLFMDSHHVLCAGATLFSERLARRSAAPAPAPAGTAEKENQFGEESGRSLSRTTLRRQRPIRLLTAAQRAQTSSYAQIPPSVWASRRQLSQIKSKATRGDRGGARFQARPAAHGPQHRCPPPPAAKGRAAGK